MINNGSFLLVRYLMDFKCIKRCIRRKQSPVFVILSLETFTHQRKVTQQLNQPQENQISNNPPPLQQELFPIYQFSPTYTPLQETYSLEDFIQNLQSQQLLYQGYFDHYDNTNAPIINKRPIELINSQYLQKIGIIDRKEDLAQPKILFGQEMTVKYYCEHDAPQSIAKYQEYTYPIEKHYLQEQQNFDMI